jgi:RNA polymerase sigma-70 factor (ECF subfamily)
MWLFGKKQDVNDEELVARYLSTGDKSLVGQLFEKHARTVFGVCLFYFKDKAVAKDAVMHIFEKLMVELRRTEVKNFQGWLSFVVRNHCLNELRKNKGRHFVSEHYLDFEMQEPRLEEEQKIAMVSEERMLAHLREVLPQLKEKQRQCVELFYLREQSYEQISKTTGYTLNEVKSYIQNGKRNLKLMIESKEKSKGNDAA